MPYYFNPVEQVVFNPNNKQKAPSEYIVQSLLPGRYIDDIPGFVVGAGGNAVTNAALLQASLNTYGGVHLFRKAGGQYNIGPVTFPANSGLDYRGDLSNLPIVYLPASVYTSVALDPVGSANSTFAIAWGLVVAPWTPKTGIVFRNFIIQAEVNDNGRVLCGLSIRNVTNPIVENVQFTGFAASSQLILDTVTNSVNESLLFHDSTTNYVYGGPVNVAGVTLDNDRVNGVDSTFVKFFNCGAKNLTNGAAFIASQGPQSNFIATNKAKFVEIIGCWSDTVYQPVDTYGQGVAISNCTFTNALSNIAIKHGAQNIAIDNCILSNCNEAHLYIVGGTATDQATKNIAVSNCIMSGIYNIPGYVNTPKANVKIDNKPVGGFDADNVVIDNCIYDGTGLQYNYWDLNAAGSVAHRNAKVVAKGSSGSSNFTTSVKSFMLAAKPIFKGYASADQNITLGTSATVQYNTVVFDTTSSFNTSTYTYVVPYTGIYKCGVRSRTGNPTSGNTSQLKLNKNGSVFAQNNYYYSFTNQDYDFEISDVVFALEGDSLTVNFNNNGAANVTLARNELTAFIIEQVA